MENQTHCPKCNSENIYHDGSLWVCPECAHEWTQQTGAEEAADAPAQQGIRDSVGNILADGDSVTVIKDLKIKGAASGIKAGTKVKNIRLLADAEDGHDIACKIDGVGAINLKSQFVKKA